MSDKEMAAEVYAHRDDPGEWDETPLQADEVTATRGVVLSFRLPSTEFVALQKISKETGETLSEFIRNAIALRLHGEPVTNAVQINSGVKGATIQATFVASVLSAGQAVNPNQLGPDPDRIPTLANLPG